jgi:hypothetical protein
MQVQYDAIRNPKPKAIVIHCIDPRFPRAFEEFIERELGLDRYRDIVKKTEGGPTPLAYPTVMPSRCKGLRKKLEFSCDKFRSIERIIAIAHKNCAYYSTVPACILDSCPHDEIERRDLPLIGEFLAMTFPHKKIELYHAKLVNSDHHVVFESVSFESKEPAISNMDQWVLQANSATKKA